MHSDTMPGWLKVLLTLLAVVVLGPPALALLIWALAVTFAVGVVALKVGVVALVLFAVVALFRAVFGASALTALSPSPRASSLEDLSARMEAEERAKREQLDRELAAAVQSTP